MNKDYELYYRIPWPDYQAFEAIDPRGEHSSSTCDCEFYAEKSWVDNLKPEDFDNVVPIDLDIESWLDK